MLRCPQCQKPLPQIVRRCPSCQADLDLLVDYVNHLQGGLERADNLVRAGELDQAVWAYLEVLEVDPDNAAARRQVSRVATAVRQFDRTSGSRSWWRLLSTAENQESFFLPPWCRTWVMYAVIFVLGLALGYGLAPSATETAAGPPSEPVLQRPPPTLGGP